MSSGAEDLCVVGRSLKAGSETALVSILIMHKSDSTQNIYILITLYILLLLGSLFVILDHAYANAHTHAHTCALLCNYKFNCIAIIFTTQHVCCMCYTCKEIF